ncbi:IPT/TIG domain-containing protein [Cellulosimicrobium cellulans]|uniref:phage tail tube protein n=1 Tax=Cellulosimicrobium cellulans TaxID=1710 RepID=UPI00196257B6|nr:IPT/TIG domain-containing protein [Cellulosimicrobium cellulans]MBN0039388.1 IPT/TIG domain-containing protein [Cellulosimicrobium cellulans]
MPDAPALPAGATLGKSFEYGIQIDLGYPGGTENWVNINRISDFNPTPTPVTQDVQTYDDFGAPNEDKTSESWAVAFSVLGNRIAGTGKFVPDVQKLVDSTRPETTGEAAVVRVRYFHKPESITPDPDDAYEGLATASLARQNAGADGAAERIGVTLTGKGKRKSIVNPFTGWGATAPTITGVTPEGAGDGDLVTIVGSGFIGVTGITIDGAPVTEFVAVNAATIMAVVPVGDAGDVPVIVTNAAGASDAFVYTRGA